MRISEIYIQDDIKQFTAHGDFDNPSSNAIRMFDKIDRALLTNPKFQNKLIGKWKALNIPVYINAVNNPKLHKNKSRGNVITPIQLDDINDKFQLKIPYYSDGINLIYISNTIGPRFISMPMTKWIMAHRIAEDAVYINPGQTMWSQVRNIIDDNIIDRIYRGITDKIYYVDDKRSEFIFALFTMKTARDKDPGLPADRVPELFAQFVETGTNNFNVDGLFEMLEKDGIVLDQQKKLFIQEVLIKAQAQLKECFMTFLNYLVGKIMVVS